MQYG
jgi:VanZ family protein